MKKLYEDPEIEVVRLGEYDVIVTSSCGAEQDETEKDLGL